MSAVAKWKAFGRATTGRRLLFVGVNILLVLAFYFIFIEPVRRMIADGAQSISDRRQTLARYEAVATQEERVQEYAREISDINAQGELFDGESDGVINANLQARLKTLAESTQVTIRSIEMLPDKVFEGVTLVGARIAVSGSYLNVHRLTRALEGEPPLLLITAATVRGQTMLWGAQPTQENEEIEAQFDVFGGAPKKGRP